MAGANDKDTAFKRSAELADDNADGVDDEDEDDVKVKGDDDEDEDADEDAGKDKGGKADAGDEDEDDASERRARLLGWVPEDQWKGDPDKWVPAKTFLARTSRNRKTSEDVIGKLEKVIDRQGTKIDQLEGIVSESGKVLRTIHDRFKSVDKNALARARREVETQRLKAVEDADTEEFNKAETRLANIAKQEAAAEADGEDASDKGGKDGKHDDKDKARRDPVVAAWVEDNKWFDEDLTLAKAAEGIHLKIRREHPTWSTKKNLEEVARQIRTRFPEEFENDADDRRGRDTISTDMRRGGGNGRDTDGARKGRTFNDLPKHAQDAYWAFRKTMPDYTKKEYLEIYEWD